MSKDNDIYLVLVQHVKHICYQIRLCLPIGSPQNHVLLLSTACKQIPFLVYCKIIDSSIRLNAMIGKILDVDAIESNRVNLQLENIDMNALTKRIVSSFDKAAAKKEINLSFSPAPATVSVKGDMLYMTEIIENLLSNAIKFSRRKKSVSIEISVCDLYALLRIRDEGPGLTEDDKQKIFQKFQRLSAQPTEGERSTGLGLSIVKKYTELMNGRIWFESEVGTGTSFNLEFPKA